MDTVSARRTVRVPDEAIVGCDDSFVQNPDKHPMTTLANLLADHDWAGGRVGVEMDNYSYSAKVLAVLAVRLTLVDATGLVNWQRAVKSLTEILRMRRAAAIVAAMHRRILEVAEPGLPKNVLVAEILRSGVLGAGGHWGDYPAIAPMAPSGMTLRRRI